VEVQTRLIAGVRRSRDIRYDAPVESLWNAGKNDALMLRLIRH
jgi:hypothetical protein